MHVFFFISDGEVKLDSQPKAVDAHNGTVVVASIQHVSYIYFFNMNMECMQ